MSALTHFQEHKVGEAPGVNFPSLIAALITRIRRRMEASAEGLMSDINSGTVAFDVMSDKALAQHYNNLAAILEEEAKQLRQSALLQEHPLPPEIEAEFRRRHEAEQSGADNS